MEMRWKGKFILPNRSQNFISEVKRTQTLHFMPILVTFFTRVDTKLGIYSKVTYSQCNGRKERFSASIWWFFLVLYTFLVECECIDKTSIFFPELGSLAGQKANFGKKQFVCNCNGDEIDIHALFVSAYISPTHAHFNS